MEKVMMDEQMKEEMWATMERIRHDREGFRELIIQQIDDLIAYINSYDKIYILGGLGVKLIRSTPTLYNQFLENHDGEQDEGMKDEMRVEDDKIEVLLEYAMNLATAYPNRGNRIPTQDAIDEVYERLASIKSNLNFYEISAEIPEGGGENDRRLRLNILLESLNVIGEGYSKHVQEVFKEMFEPFDGFFEQFYGFKSSDIWSITDRLHLLVLSKIGNVFGATLCYERFEDWLESSGLEGMNAKMQVTAKNFIDDNPDLFDDDMPNKITGQSLSHIEGFKKLFWVIPQTEKEEKIFELLAQKFGDNQQFVAVKKFKGFALGDSNLNLKPLIKVDDKYYCFSTYLLSRNRFLLAADLLKRADETYFENNFLGNINSYSRDNYNERKARALFEKMLPSVQFFTSLNYRIKDENDVDKLTELDILGVSKNAIYIIEVKAGTLHKKHKRGALKGLKDRIEQVIGYGAFQCQRAETHILNLGIFEYVEGGQRKSIGIDEPAQKKIFKITVTYEAFSSVSTNPKNLVDLGLINAEIGWTWIVSLYDLMAFSELMETEEDFQDYLAFRFSLYEKDGIMFLDEIDVLGYFLNEGAIVPKIEQNQYFLMTGYSEDIDEYFENIGPWDTDKPKRKTR
jgi:hypothetical protein